MKMFKVLVRLGLCWVSSLSMMATVSAQEPSLVEQGEKVFQRDCAGCHEVGPKARNSVGPHLNSLFGRHAAGVAEFKFYSKALKASDLIWTKENFAEFIENPREMILNNKQIFDGIKDKNEISALVSYLEKFQE